MLSSTIIISIVIYIYIHIHVIFLKIFNGYSVINMIIKESDFSTTVNRIVINVFFL